MYCILLEIYKGIVSKEEEQLQIPWFRLWYYHQEVKEEYMRTRESESISQCKWWQYNVIQSYAQAIPSSDPKIEPYWFKLCFQMLQSSKKLKSRMLQSFWLKDGDLNHTCFIGEYTITLEDVALEPGLCIDGRPVTGLTYYDQEQMCTEYIVAIPLENVLVGHLN